MKKILLSAVAALGMAACAQAQVAQQMWIIGADVAGEWNPTVGIELTKVSDGVFEYNADFSKNSEFGFVNQLGADGSDWDGMNAHRYAPENKGDVPVVGENKMFYATSDNCWSLPAGKYHFTIDTNTMTFTLGGDTPVVKPSTLYYVGAVNNWTFTEGYEFSTEDGVIYTYKAAVIRGGEDTDFKIAGEGWKPEYTSKNDAMEAGKVYDLVANEDGSANMRFAADLEEAELILNTEALTLTVNDKNHTVGIESVAAETAAPEYFNLQGVRVENPSNGLYIRRQGNTVEKVMVK